MADVYYALTLIANGASTGAYYSVTPTSDLEFSQGGATINPSAISAVMVNIYPETMQISAPAGSVNAAVTIITGASEIAGRILVSPPVNVAVVVTLYGVGGQQVGQAIVDPGTGDRLFNFPVTPAQGIPPHEIDGVVRGLVPPATP